ncbi:MULTISPECIES: hypothetical protein [Streptomyces]|uniref:Uncharacterized protein n=1 Tax=Streptomyces dengpaensis TaxID=2049881 RepID=A0ABN5IAM5_9ACTN|nr:MULTISPECIES: hypothetical protein [Streptomyces]AVH60021.1 hypothetical protein C4B68_34285 [Streptomyces dengpaensis]PIB09659.1 hypothetical protein B1C81_10960 [Streptomyces sp. HG99]
MSQPNDDTGRRCPRCDCPDNAPQCDHCKVCPHASGPRPATSPELAIALYEDDGILTLGIRPDGSIVTGPNYQPDEAAREFWDAVTRAAQAASPIPTLVKEQA